MTEVGEEWLRSIDRFGKVGSRHHVIPKFLLQNWADPNGSIWVKQKQDLKEGVRNIRDVGITDFYTFLATDGQLDSSMEELLSVVEGQAARVLEHLNNPYSVSTNLTPEQFEHLATFVAFQMARSPRRRREYELMADWYGKTMAAGQLASKITEDELRTLEFVPHQNEHISTIGPMANTLTDLLMDRPFCLITIDRPLFLIGDEPVVVSTADDDVHHSPDCSMSEEEFEQKLKRAAKRKGRRRREVRRLVHVYPTQPRSIATAFEVVMPISPRTVMWFGPATGWDGVVERERVVGDEADELADRVNERIAEYALDVVVGRVADQKFRASPIPERTPLLVVCGSDGAARDAVMSVPKRLRPRRLDRNTGLPGSKS